MPKIFTKEEAKKWRETHCVACKSTKIKEVQPFIWKCDVCGWLWLMEVKK
jgi:ribosomal protein L37AE/L43A